MDQKLPDRSIRMRVLQWWTFDHNPSHVLGPLYFLLYTTPILRIVEESGFNIHAYADDLQIYAHGDPFRSALMVNRLSDCVDVVKGWMASNRLRINPTRTEVIWLGSRSCLQHCPKSPLFISGALITPSSQVRNLGVVIDSELSITTHVNNLVKVCLFHLRQLRLIRRSLDFDAAPALIRAFIHSRLDYCNSVLSGVSNYLLGRLQTVLNSSVRLLLQRCTVVKVYQSGCATSCIGYVSHSGSHTNK